MSFEGKTFVGCVPFFGMTQYENDEPRREFWQIGQGESPHSTSFGSVEVEILEVIDSRVSGQVAIYKRSYIDPDGELVTKSRKRIGPLAAVKGYITKWGLHELPGASA